MYLEDLPMLRPLSWFGLGKILQNLYYLQVSKCGNLINIISPSMAKILVQLKILSITSCSMVKEIGGDDDASEEEATDDICFTASNSSAFPSLKEMEVKELLKLTHLYKKIPGLVQNLQTLHVLEISGCGNLEILFTLLMAKTVVQLERLVVRECDKMNEIVENEGGGDHQATDNDEIIFTKLRSLHLRRLPNLKSFSTASNNIKFPSLEEMEAIECPEMEYFCKGDLTTERLKRVKVDYCRSY